MASSPVKLLILLLLVCIVGWIIFMFAARLVALLLSRILGASVGFRISGWNCLRDVSLKFKKGAVESISVGEIKLSLHRSLVKLGFSFISKDPKVQLLICDLEITIRHSDKKAAKIKNKPRSSSRGKWMVLANIARFLSVSVTDLLVKMPKVTIEIKNMGLDLFKTNASNPTLKAKLHSVPLLLHFPDPSVGDQLGCFLGTHAFSPVTEKNSIPFVCDDLSLECEFGHNREIGIGIRGLDVTSGDVTVNLSEDMFLRKTLETSHGTDISGTEVLEPTTAKKSNSIASLKKTFLMFPEKVTFNLPKLDLKYLHHGQGFYVENNIMGIHLKSSKSQTFEDTGEATSRFDVQMDFSEIHLLSEGSNSILEILKVAVITSIDVPMQSANPVRTEIDVKLGGTQCNLILSRLMPLLCLQQSKKKKIVLQGRGANFHQEPPPITESKAIMWTCTVSAPEMNIVLHDINDLPLYHVCSQSSHLFANNIASNGVQVHTELGELHLYVADEHQVSFKENLFGIEANYGSLVHIERASLDLGHRETEAHDRNRCLVFSIDVTGMGVYLNFQQVESLTMNAMSFKSLLQKLSVGKKEKSNVGHSSKSVPRGVQIFKLNLEQCSVIFSGDVGVEDTVVADPKRVNFGSQGGKVTFSVSANGTTRQAHITSMVSNGRKYLKNSTVLDIFHLSLDANKEKQSTRMELERARSVYKEYSEELGPITKVTLFDVQNAKFVRRPGGLNENSICSLFSATDITARWEPDVHLALYEVTLRLRCMLHNMNLKRSSNEIPEDLNMKTVGKGNKSVIHQLQHDKQKMKKDSVFAVDIEVLRISSELADGVEALVQVQSIFSENAKIGILLEGLVLSFNDARVFKSSRMQISRLPVFTSTDMLDGKVPVATRWDWAIQGLDVHICMPYRLPLRAIEDAVEDTLRGLKLICSAKTCILFPAKNNGTKMVKTGPSMFGSLRFNIRKLSAEIEEEPMQGWLDEHYHLMKNLVSESATRLKFFDDLVSEGSKCTGIEQNEMITEKKVQYDGVDIDVHNLLDIEKLREEIQKKSFRSYFLACQKLVHSGGSGACTSGLQAGFKPSTARSSLLSLSATELDLTLNRIEGDDIGMIKFIRNLDAVSVDNDIPFSRLYGRNMVLHTGSLIAQIRNYTFPLFSGTLGKCEGCIVLAQQATCFQPQIEQNIYIGRWRKVCMLRSASGTTPPMKMYSNLPLFFKRGEISFGVGYEPAFADISYAFTIALRRANLSVRSSKINMQNVVSLDSSQNGSTMPLENHGPKKERSLPWWDDMRYYIHGNISLSFDETRWNMHGTTNPYEKLDKFQIVSGYMDIQQTDGRVSFLAKEFKIFVSSLESMVKNCSLKLPACASVPFIYSSSFSLEVIMDWKCESGNHLNHYLHALPNEGVPRSKVYDPFRSTSLSLRWNFSLRPCSSDRQDISASLNESVFVGSQKSEDVCADTPTMNLGPHDLVWLFKWWSMFYNPPHKLRSFSRWPRFGIPRATRSGNLSLDKVMIEFFLRVDATPTCIKHVTLGEDDPASGLTFRMTKLKYELCYSRGKKHYTFDCKREPLDLVYRGLDLHMLKAFSYRDGSTVNQDYQTVRKSSQSVLSKRTSNGRSSHTGSCSDRHQDDGFLLSSDHFTIRRQAPKADPTRLLAWQDAGRKNLEMTYVRSEFENGSESDHTRSDPSDDDGYNVVIADNCQLVFVYGLKLLWTIQNRDAVWSWVGGISKAFEHPKPSPSRQYAQRKSLEEREKRDRSEVPQYDSSKSLPASCKEASFLASHSESLGSHPSTSPTTKMDSLPSNLTTKNGLVDDEEEGTRHFMVNVIQPQFNLHAEDGNGRFLLAAASGRVLARSFHSVVQVGFEVIEKALGTGDIKVPETEPEMTWKRTEYSVMLKHVQAHVAPTDVDPGAGLQWLPEIVQNKKRTGALLERVFTPCQMYFRYTRHKGGLADWKVKPLKELTFNSPDISATMTSRQFNVMLGVLTNLLFARLPKPQKSILSYPTEDEDIEEEIDEVVPDGVEEVELARIDLEQKERERKLLIDDIRSILISSDSSTDLCLPIENESEIWMITGTKSTLVQGLKKELSNIQKSRKTASVGLRLALQKAAQTRLMEEKNKSPSCAMRISVKINKVVWSMLADGKTFAEAEINDMIYDFDRDYKDIGVAQFTTRSFAVRNLLPNVKSDVLLSSWNPPLEWGRDVMLRVDAKQGAPKDGTSPLELFQVEIYPLKIHLTETMYRMMWEYFFPEEEQDSHRRQEVWKVSTTAGTRRGWKSSSGAEAASTSYSLKEFDASERLSSTTATLSLPGPSQSSTLPDASQVSKLQNLKASNAYGSNSELHQTSSCDRTWEDNGMESVGNEIVMYVHSSDISSSRSSPLKDSKPVKPGRASHEEKKVNKTQDEKRSRTRKMMEFHNIKISQVELIVTYEGSRFAVNELRLLLDTFNCVEFTGTWRRLFSRIKKRIIWGVLKSVTGMQGKKFKDKSQNHKEGNGATVPDLDEYFSDIDGGQSDQLPALFKRTNDGAGDGFVTSIKGLFNSQRRKAKAFVLRTMRGDLDNEAAHPDWTEVEVEVPALARQITMKGKKLLKKHTKKFHRPKGLKKSETTSQPRGSQPSSPPKDTVQNQSDSSSASHSHDEDTSKQ